MRWITMADEVQQFRTIFLGKTYVSIGDVRQRNNELQFKKVGGFPLLNPFVPVLANADEIPYQEREIWHPGIGATGVKIRIYLADLRLDKYYSMINPQDLNTISHLKKENESLHQEIERLFQMLYDVSNEDRWKKRIKKEVEAYNAIKGFGFQNQGYGFNQGMGLGMGGGFGPGPDSGMEPQQ
jgi:hypothetical protein